MRIGPIRCLLWILDAALLALCGLFAAQTAQAVAEALRAPPVSASRPPAAPAEDSSGPEPAASAAIIVSRDLFATRATPTPPPAEPEEVEATELPLGLVGTAYSPDPDLAQAVVWNAWRGERRVVGVGDAIAGGAATVMRIERRRILLREEGDIREVSIDAAEHRPPTRAQRRAHLRALKRAQRKHR